MFPSLCCDTSSAAEHRGLCCGRVVLIVCRTSLCEVMCGNVFSGLTHGIHNNMLPRVCAECVRGVDVVVQLYSALTKCH